MYVTQAVKNAKPGWVRVQCGIRHVTPPGNGKNRWPLSPVPANGRSTLACARRETCAQSTPVKTSGIFIFWPSAGPGKPLGFVPVCPVASPPLSFVHRAIICVTWFLAFCFSKQHVKKWRNVFCPPPPALSIFCQELLYRPAFCTILCKNKKLKKGSVFYTSLKVGNPCPVKTFPFHKVCDWKKVTFSV